MKLTKILQKAVRPTPSFLVRLFVFGLSLVVFNCGLSSSGTEDPGTDPSTNPTPKALVNSTDCNELLSYFQNKTIAEMESTIDYYSECYETVEYSSDDSSADSTSSSDSSVEFSVTNLQEEGVDETDIIKSNGNYIYVATPGGIEIFKTWPLDDFAKVGSYEISDGFDELFLVDETLIALNSYYDLNTSLYVTAMTVLSLKDPETPSVVETRMAQGSLIKARLVDGVVHLVLSTSVDIPNIEYPDNFWDTYERVCYDNKGSEDELKELGDQIKQDYQDTVSQLSIEDFLPQYNNGNNWESIDCSAFYYESESDENNLLGILSYDLDEDSLQLTYVSGWVQEVYASTQSIYMASNDWEEDATHLHHFVIGSDNLLHSYVGTGAVNGHIENSFSMSEVDGSFRIATTYGNVSADGSSEVTNNLYVLDTSANDLPLIGSIENIAEGEEIYAARFIGNKGYIVTFEKIDPLFVIDLSDPTNPIIEGELKMPGYSTYLHALGEDHLIGFGKDAEDSGSFSWFQGLKLATFDVSDGNDPSTIEELIIGGRGSDSEALYEHHAFNYDSSTGILALPLSLYDESSGGSDYGEFQYNGVHLYSISDDGTIETLAEISLNDESYSQNILRTLFVGEGDEQGLYVLDEEGLTLIDMNQNYEIISSIDLTDSLGEEWDLMW